MVDPSGGRALLTLRRLARQAAEASVATMERCDFCAELIPPEHRHLLEVSARAVRCVCRACSILFDRDAASEGRYRLIPDRRLLLEDFQISDAEWSSLRIPVGLAFIVDSTPAEKVVAYYPSPAGPTEAFLDPATWADLTRKNPILRTMRRDVEALLVNRARGARQYYLVPIDDCFRLVAVVRTNWRGLSGGQELWQQAALFLSSLDESAKRHRDPADQTLSESPREG